MDENEPLSNKIRSHLVTISAMTPFTSKNFKVEICSQCSAPKLFDSHPPRFISRANTAQSY